MNLLYIVRRINDKEKALHIEVPIIFIINKFINYNSFLRNSSPDSTCKYAGGISKTVLHPHCPS